jgi:hypothetical protein
MQTLSRTTEFCDLWDIPKDSIKAESNTLYQQMRDLELVLRFFALADHAAMSVSFRDHLSEFMDTRNKAYKTQPGLRINDQERFLRAVKSCWRVFGKEAFYKPKSDGKHQRSFPLADALMVAFADYAHDAITDAQATKARELVADLFNDADFQKAIGTGTNGRSAIATRIKMAQEAARKALS